MRWYAACVSIGLLASFPIGAQTQETGSVESPQSPPDRKTMLREKLLAQRLSADDSIVRKSVSSDLYGSGENVVSALDAIASLVDRQLGSVQPNDPLADEIAWHLKALAASGLVKYRDQILKGTLSVDQDVAAHAKSALQLLEITGKTGHPLLLRSKVRAITAIEAQECVLVRPGQSCGSMRGEDACRYDLGFQAMEAGADSYLVTGSSGRGWLMRSSISADFYLCRGDFTKEPG